MGKFLAGLLIGIVVGMAAVLQFSNELEAIATWVSGSSLGEIVRSIHSAI